MSEQKKDRRLSTTFKRAVSAFGGAAVARGDGQYQGPPLPDGMGAKDMMDQQGVGDGASTLMASTDQGEFLRNRDVMPKLMTPDQVNAYLDTGQKEFVEFEGADDLFIVPPEIVEEYARLTGPPEGSVTGGDFGRKFMAGGASIAAGTGWLTRKLSEDFGMEGTAAFGAALENLGNDAVEFWYSGLSDAAKYELSKEFIRKNERGELEWGDAGWMTAALHTVGSLTGTAGGMGIGASLTKLLQAGTNPMFRSALVARAQAGNVEAMRKLKIIDGVIGATGFGMGEGFIGGIMTAGEVRREVFDLDYDTIAKNERYQELYEATDESLDFNDRHQRALNRLADEASSSAGLRAGTTTGLLGAPTGALFGNWLGASKLLNPMLNPRTMAGRVMLAIPAEGAQEFFQEGAEDMWVNLTLMALGDDRELFDGALNAAVGGMMSGMLMGGALAAGTSPGKVSKPQTAKEYLNNALLMAAKAGADYGDLMAILKRAGNQEISLYEAVEELETLERQQKNWRHMADPLNAPISAEEASELGLRKVPVTLAMLEAVRDGRSTDLSRDEQYTLTSEGYAVYANDKGMMRFLPKGRRSIYRLTTGEMQKAAPEGAPPVDQGQVIENIEMTTYDTEIDRLPDDPAEIPDYLEVSGGPVQRPVDDAVLTQSSEEQAAERRARRNPIIRSSRRASTKDYDQPLQRTPVGGIELTPEMRGFAAQIESGAMRNPLNDRELILGGEAGVTLRPYAKNTYYVSLIRSFEQGKGAGRRALQALTKAADANGINLVLEPVPVKNRDGKYPMNKRELNSWYRRNGFRPSSDHGMVREPGGVQAKIRPVVQPSALREQRLAKVKAEQKALRAQARQVFTEAGGGAAGQQASAPLVKQYRALEQERLALTVGKREMQRAIDEAANMAATSPKNDLPMPTEAQIKAGNYQKGSISLQGLEISIENPKGSKREGESRNRMGFTVPWVSELKNHYGYILGTKGRDKDHIDVFLGNSPYSQHVTIINQINPETGAFDEHKVMLGFESHEEAIEAYMANYPPYWDGLGDAVETDIDTLKEWLAAGNTKLAFLNEDTSPAGGYFPSWMTDPVMGVEEGGASYTITNMYVAGGIASPTQQIGAVFDAVESSIDPQVLVTQQTGTTVVGTLKHGLKDGKISSYEDMAHLMAPLRKLADEMLMIAITDSEGKILRVVMHSKGNENSSHWFGTVLSRDLFAVEGATQFWMGHAHPGGTPDHSSSDIRVITKTVAMLHGSGISFTGSVVVTLMRDGRTGGSVVEAGSQLISRPFTGIPAMPRTLRQPVSVATLRVLRSPMRTITAPDTAIAFATSVVPHYSTPVVMMLDYRNQVVGLLPITGAELETMRTGDRATGLGRLYAAMGNVGAVGVILAHSGQLTMDQVRNFLALREVEINALDVIHDVHGSGILASEANRGTSGAGILRSVKASGVSPRIRPLMDWIKGSVAVTDKGTPIRFYHGSHRTPEDFLASAKERGLHFGTAAQANTRVLGRQEGGALFPAYLHVRNPKRVVDTGSNNWKQEIKAAIGDGHDSLVYLNRYEGIDPREFDAAREEGIDIDALTDKQFQKRFPSARDSYVVFDGAQVYPALDAERDGPQRFELPESSRVVKTETKAFKTWFGKSKVTHEDGSPLVVYHGTRRADRIGTRFLRKRSTSGPMPFFSQSSAVASRYSTAKQDTSLSREEEGGYENWFRVRLPGDRKATPVGEIWNRLSSEQRARILRQAGTVRLDDAGNVIAVEGGRDGLGGFSFELSRQRNNPLKALVEQWLNGGTLFNDESLFFDVLKLAGLDLPVEMHDPQASYSGVIPVYLSIQNPLDTGNIPSTVHEALEKAARRQPMPSQEAHMNAADLWDKTAVNPQDWIERLNYDREKGTDHAWTSIPDWVTRTLKRQGYDGIKDTGGKLGGPEHVVWVPFEPTQIKSATGNIGTYDSSNPNILRNVRYARGTPAKGMARADVESIARELVAGLPGAAEVTVVQSPRELPDWIQTALRAEGDGWQSTTGIYIQGYVMDSVYLIADNIHSPQEAIETFYHEQVGHHGLRSVLNPMEYMDLMDEVWQAFPGDVKQAADRNHLDWNNIDERRVAAEEFIAYTAQAMLAGGKVQRGLKGLLARIAKALSSMYRLITGRPMPMNMGRIYAVIAESINYMRHPSGRARHETMDLRKSVSRGPFRSALSELLANQKVTPGKASLEQWRKFFDAKMRDGTIKRTELEFSESIQKILNFEPENGRPPTWWDFVTIEGDADVSARLRASLTMHGLSYSMPQAMLNELYRVNEPFPEATSEISVEFRRRRDALQLLMDVPIQSISRETMQVLQRSLTLHPHRPRGEVERSFFTDNHSEYRPDEEESVDQYEMDRRLELLIEAEALHPDHYLEVARDLIERFDLKGELIDELKEAMAEGKSVSYGVAADAIDEALGDPDVVGVSRDEDFDYWVREAIPDDHFEDDLQEWAAQHKSATWWLRWRNDDFRIEMRFKDMSPDRSEPEYEYIALHEGSEVGTYDDYDDAASALDDLIFDLSMNADAAEDLNSTVWEGYMLEGGLEYDEIVYEAVFADSDRLSAEHGSPFMHGHWEWDRNIVAHARIDRRRAFTEQDMEGNARLHPISDQGLVEYIGELQSDWAQQSRKRLDEIARADRSRRDAEIGFNGFVIQANQARLAIKQEWETFESELSRSITDGDMILLHDLISNLQGNTVLPTRLSMMLDASALASLYGANPAEDPVFFLKVIGQAQLSQREIDAISAMRQKFIDAVAPAIEILPESAHRQPRRGNDPEGLLRMSIDSRKDRSDRREFFPIEQSTDLVNGFRALLIAKLPSYDEAVRDDSIDAFSRIDEVTEVIRGIDAVLSIGSDDGARDIYYSYTQDNNGSPEGQSSSSIGPYFNTSTLFAPSVDLRVRLYDALGIKPQQYVRIFSVLTRNSRPARTPRTDDTVFGGLAALSVDLSQRVDGMVGERRAFTNEALRNWQQTLHGHAIPLPPLEKDWQLTVVRHRLMEAVLRGEDRVLMSTGDKWGIEWGGAVRASRFRWTLDAPLTEDMVDDDGKVIVKKGERPIKIWAPYDMDGMGLSSSDFPADGYTISVDRLNHYVGKVWADKIRAEMATGEDSGVVDAGSSATVPLNPKGGATVYDRILLPVPTNDYLTGSRAIYDDIVPNRVNRAMKRYGMKVKPAVIFVREVPMRVGVNPDGSGWIEIPNYQSMKRSGVGPVGRAYVRVPSLEQMVENAKDRSIGIRETVNVEVYTDAYQIEITDKFRNEIIENGNLIPLWSRKKTGDKDLDDALDWADKKIGPRITLPMLRNLERKIDEIVSLHNKLARLDQGLFDQFAGIKHALRMKHGKDLPAEQNAYKQAHLTTSVDAQLYVLMTRGVFEWQDNITSIKDGTKGLLEVLAPVRDNIQLWGYWMAARRANRLLKEGREALFTQDKIDELLKLGKLYPEFQQVATEWADWNRQMLDWAEQAGVINKETRPFWENADYIPFNRLRSDDLGHGFETQAGLAGAGIANQISPIRRLKGSDRALGDILENMITNIARLVTVSMRNKAALAAVDDLIDTPLISKVKGKEFLKKVRITESELDKKLIAAGVNPALITPTAKQAMLKMWAVQRPVGDDIVSVLRNGKREYYHVHDTVLFRSLTAINKRAFQSFVGKMFMTPFWASKRFVTTMITLHPGFMGANWFRDLWQQYVNSRDQKLPPAIGAFTAIKDAYSGTMSEDMLRIMAAGGAFFSGYINANDPAAVAQSIKRTLRTNNFKNSLIDAPWKLFHHYNNLGAAMENASRLASGYKPAIRAGKSVGEAVWESKDLMNFAKHGDYAAVQFLIQTIPFLNARIQGNLRFYQRFTEAPGATLIKGLLFTMASMLLFLKNREEPWYELLGEEDKDLNYHFRVNGHHIRLPKPFEVGAVFGTLLGERLPEYLMNEDGDAGRLAMDRVAFAFWQTFELRPIPQLIEPAYEVSRNWDFFGERNIVPPHFEEMPPEFQFNQRTSPLAREIAQVMPDIMFDKLQSPMNIEHLIRGYTGTIGAELMMLTDDLIRKGNPEVYPPRPPLRWGEIPLVKRFYRGDPDVEPPASNKFEKSVYEIRRKARGIERAVRALEESERLDEREDFLSRPATGYRGVTNQDILNSAKAMRRPYQSIRDIRKRIDRIYLDREMTPDQKLREINDLHRRLHEVSRDGWLLRPGAAQWRERVSEAIQNGAVDPAVAVEAIIEADEPEAAEERARSIGMESTAELIGSVRGDRPEFIEIMRANQ